MLEKLKNIIFSRKQHVNNRVYNYKLFLKSEYQSQLEEDGYVLLRNVLNINKLNKLKAIYKEGIEKFDFYKDDSNFLNTFALQNCEIKYFFKEKTTLVIQELLTDIIDVNSVDIPLGGAFCINPPNAIQSCKPHQDPAYVDETKTYSVIAWFPLENTNINNGRIHVLPKSHLWGNSSRSISMDWAFEKFSEDFWKYLIPIDTNCGDLIIFDTALIHGTNINITNQNRLAFNVPIMNKNERMITFFTKGKNKALCYEIDADYYLGESLFNKPSDKYNSIKDEVIKSYTYNDLMNLLNLSKI